MNPKAVTTALRLLAYFWLEEVQTEDLKTIAALPDLAESLASLDQVPLTELAAEYQRLFGFNLPPYESVFIDPSAMLMAPATQRVQRLYRQANWTLPQNVRAGAPDHLGLELMALADWLDAEDDQAKTAAAIRLQAEHLALWVPPYIIAFQRLSPLPFYRTLSQLTLDLLLSTLSPQTVPAEQNLFPTLPPPPVFRSSDEATPDFAADEASGDQVAFIPAPAEERSLGLRQLIKQLLPPREAGLCLTREDLAQVGQSLKLAVGMGDRYRMLETLFREAGQYDMVPQLLTALAHLLTVAEQAYQALADEYPVWQPYARAWTERLQTSQALFADLGETLRHEGASKLGLRQSCFLGKT